MYSILFLNKVITTQHIHNFVSPLILVPGTILIILRIVTHLNLVIFEHYCYLHFTDENNKAQIGQVIYQLLCRNFEVVCSNFEESSGVRK